MEQGLRESFLEDACICQVMHASEQREKIYIPAYMADLPDALYVRIVPTQQGDVRRHHCRDMLLFRGIDQPS